MPGLMQLSKISLLPGAETAGDIYMPGMLPMLPPEPLVPLLGAGVAIGIPPIIPIPIPPPEPPMPIMLSIIIIMLSIIIIMLSIMDAMPLVDVLEPDIPGIGVAWGAAPIPGMGAGVAMLDIPPIMPIPIPIPPIGPGMLPDVLGIGAGAVVPDIPGIAAPDCAGWPCIPCSMPCIWTNSCCSRSSMTWDCVWLATRGGCSGSGGGCPWHRSGRKHSGHPGMPGTTGMGAVRPGTGVATAIPGMPDMDGTATAGARRGGRCAATSRLHLGHQPGHASAKPLDLTAYAGNLFSRGRTLQIGLQAEHQRPHHPVDILQFSHHCLHVHHRGRGGRRSGCRAYALLLELAHHRLEGAQHLLHLPCQSIRIGAGSRGAAAAGGWEVGATRHCHAAHCAGGRQRVPLES